MANFIWVILVIAPLLAVTVVILVIPCLLLKLFRQDRACDSLVFFAASLLANLILVLSGLKVNLVGDVEEVRRRVNSGEGLCYVSNHTSMMDIVITLAKLKGRCGFVAKKELQYVPLLNIVIMMVHSVFLDRKNIHKSVASIKKATNNIRHGRSMYVFPEGTRSKTGEIGEFKHGSFRLATESGASIVPITIKGARSALETRSHWFQRSECFYHVGKPITPPPATDRVAVSAMIAEVENSIRETYRSL